MALRSAPIPADDGPDADRRDPLLRLLADRSGEGAEHAPATAHAPAPAHASAPEPSADGERRFATLIEQAADGIFVTDAAGRIVLANSRMCLLLGYSPDEIAGLDVIETYLPEEREIGRQFLSRLSAGTTFRFERMLRRKDGTAFPIEASVASLPGGERQTIVRDMTARKRAEEALRMDERRLRSLVRLPELESTSLPELFDAALDEICGLVRSPFGAILTFREETGIVAATAWSRDVRERTSDAPPPLILPLAEIGLLGAAIRERRPVLLNAVPPGERIAGLPPERALSKFLAIPVRSRGRIVGSIAVGDKPADYDDADVRQLAQMADVAWKIAERQHAEDELRALNEALERRVAERTAEYEAANARLETANGDLAAANEKLEGANTQLQSLLAEQEVLHAELAYRALHDPLTGLGNRVLFAQRLEYAFEQTRRGVAVLWIDLDRFKQINDIFGHDVGDEVLVAIAEKLREVLRTTDDVARIGGDEFAIVLPNVHEGDATMVARRVFEALTNPGAFRLRVGASIGVAWAAPGRADGRHLLRQADLAMYRAKGAGGGIATG